MNDKRTRATGFDPTLTGLTRPSRRGLLKAGAGLASLAAMGPLSARAQGNEITVGFIYVGPKDDFGYNQAHAEGAAAVAAMDGVTIIEEENVAETVDVQNTMRSMIEFDGATLLFPTSFGYFNPHILEVAPDYPDVRFQHAGGLVDRRDAEECRVLFRLHLDGAVPQRRRRRACVEVQEARLRRRQADPAGAAEYQRLLAWRAQRRS